MAMAVVRVGPFESHAEAELARGMLDAHGIATRVTDVPGPVHGMRTALSRGPSLLVDEEDVAETRRLLDEVRAAPAHAFEADPGRSPFDDTSRPPWQRRLERAVFGVVGLYALLRVAELALG
jgi:hypothetical protein